MSKQTIYRALWLAFAIVILAGCSQSGQFASQEAQATELLPTWIAGTIQARQPPFPITETTPLPASSEAATPDQATEPTSTPSATQQSLPDFFTATPPESSGQVTDRPTRIPTATPAPAIPDAAIQVNEPGPLSRIISPLHLSAWVKPGGDGRVRIELLGEDGRLLVRKILRYGADNRSFFLDETLEFEISGVAETGRLQISTYDTYGRLVNLAAQELILLSIGEKQINPPGELTELVIIQAPRPNTLIQGETVLISGLALTFDGQDLLVELIARDGRVVGYRQAFVPQNTGSAYTPFVVEVPFKIEAATNVRITIQGFDRGRIGGIIYVTSQEILLSP